MKFLNNSLEDVSVDIGKIAEDNLSSMNTEDSLLSSKASSQTISKHGEMACCPKEEIKRKCKGPKFKIITGLVLALYGVSTIIWTPFDVMMAERLRMRTWLPPYRWWKTPPNEVLLRVYVFNITNAEEFLSGEHTKLNVQEIGPILFMEKLTHTNVVFHDNDTLTYEATRKAIFLPDRNTIDLNATITVANIALLGMASYLWDAPFFEKWAFNMLVRGADSNVTINTTIYNYLWNFSDPIVGAARTVSPSMVPVTNLGMLSRIYDNFRDNVTVYIGTTHGHEKYFLIDRYDGSEYIPGHGKNCSDRVINSTEGVAYPQFLTKNSTLRYWRKTLCKVYNLYYDSEDYMYGVNTYKFTLPSTLNYRTKPLYQDCYKGQPTLLDGLSDVSKCFYDFPLAASNPHFLFGNPELLKNVNGLKPNESKHGSFVYVEPITGIPINSRARSQSNLILRDLDGFKSEIEKFSNMILPMFWAEYNQVGLPWYISSLMYFTVKITPVLQRIFTAFLLITGFLLLVFGFRQHIKTKQNYLLKNKLMRYEQEVFLKE